MIGFLQSASGSYI